METTNTAVCRVPNCDEARSRRGLCALHYSRWRNNHVEGTEHLAQFLIGVEGFQGRFPVRVSTTMGFADGTGRRACVSGCGFTSADPFADHVCEAA